MSAARFTISRTLALYAKGRSLRPQHRLLVADPSDVSDSHSTKTTPEGAAEGTVPMNDAIRQKLVDAAYMSVAPALALDGMRRITTEEWLELRAASAVFQTQNGHSLANVYAFITDTGEYPEWLGVPPPDLRERLLFAYSFILAGGAPVHAAPSTLVPATPPQK